MGGVKSALAAGMKSGWKVKEEGDKEVEKDEVVVERVVRSARVKRRKPGRKERNQLLFARNVVRGKWRTEGWPDVMAPST